MRPRNSAGRIRAGTSAVGFGVEGSLLVRSLAPVVPTCGTDLARQFGMDIDDAGVRTPRTAKAYAAFLRGVESADNFAVEDDVAGALVGRGAGLRREKAGTVGVKLRTVEDRSGIPEDEVDPAFNVRVNVILAAVIGE